MSAERSFYKPKIWPTRILPAKKRRRRGTILAFLTLGFLTIAAPPQLTNNAIAQQQSAERPPSNSDTKLSSDDLLAAFEPARLFKIRRVIPKVESHCLALGYDMPGNASSAQRMLEGLLERVAVSPLGRELLRHAALREILVCLDSKTEFQGYFRSQMRLIGLNAAISPAKQIAFLVHELGHVLQHPHFSNNRNFPPRDMIRIHRFREAAAEATATAVLAELRERGDDQPWLSKLRTRYHDILRAYERVAIENKGQDDATLLAINAAFTQWFRGTWRKRFYDEMMIDHIERISKDSLGLPVPRLNADNGYLASIGRLPSGDSYLDPEAFDAGLEPFALQITQAQETRLNRILSNRRVERLNGPLP